MTFPANQEARVATVKAGTDGSRIAEALRRVAMTRPAVCFAGRKTAVTRQPVHDRPKAPASTGRSTRPSIQEAS